MPGHPARRCRPGLERLEAIVSPSSILPSQGLVNLGSSAFVGDLRNDLIRSTPHNGRQGWSLGLLEADPATRTVYGSAHLLYRVRPLGPFTSYAQEQKVHVDIAFAIPLDAPVPHDVLVTASREVPQFRENVRNTIALGVVAFIHQDGARISADLR